jgi:hypothetical protein
MPLLLVAAAKAEQLRASSYDQMLLAGQSHLGALKVKSS